MRVWAILALAGSAALAACSPVPVDVAERQCLDQARLAESPRGSVAVGVGTGGPAARVELNVSSDYLMGRDPGQVFTNCVYRRSGQFPRTPLSAQPAWKG